MEYTLFYDSCTTKLNDEEFEAIAPYFLGTSKIFEVKEDE